MGQRTKNEERKDAWNEESSRIHDVQGSLAIVALKREESSRSQTNLRDLVSTTTRCLCHDPMAEMGAVIGASLWPGNLARRERRSFSLHSARREVFGICSTHVCKAA